MADPIASRASTGGSGREQLLDAAEALFAERGIDAVSLREITAAANQRNASAVQYHFGSRDGLIRALIARHMVAINAHRNRMLDEIEAPIPPVRVVLEALVVPLAAQLDDPSGRRYLRIIDQLGADAVDDEVMEGDVNRSLNRVVEALRHTVAPLPPAVGRARIGQVTRFLLDSLAEQARQIDDRAQRSGLPNDVFTANLIDVLTAVLTAPASAPPPADVAD